MFKKITKSIRYYLGASYRRKKLDILLTKHISYFRGSVLDIGGGRRRGRFRPPKTDRWIFADIISELKPDVICNVEKMPFKNNSFDTIKATELFEHIKNPKTGLSECYRALKNSGCLIISMPFLYPIHGDPQDFQRWTDEKWKQTLKQIGFKIQEFEIAGYYFSVLADMLKNLNRSLPGFLRIPGYALYPFLDLIIIFDRFIENNIFLNKYTTGYFIIAKK